MKTYEERQKANEWSNVKRILNQERHAFEEHAKQTYYEKEKAYDKWVDATSAVVDLERKLEKAKERQESAKQTALRLDDKYMSQHKRAEKESSAAIKATKLLKKNPHINISQGTDFSVQVYVEDWHEDMEYLSTWTSVLEEIEIILTAS